MSPDHTARLLTAAQRLERYTAGMAAVILTAVLGMIAMPALASVLQGLTP